MSIDTIRLDGNALCLNFINTVHDRVREPENDYLNSSADVVRWAARAGIIEENARNEWIERLTHDAHRSLLQDTLTLRELLYRMFRAVSQGANIDSDALHAFNQILPPCLSLLQLVPNQQGYTYRWSVAPDERLTITAPVVHSAYTLLLSDQLPRVKACPQCGWLFLDTTKNGKRKWCSMKTCGSNAKALAWYYRQKEAPLK